MLISLQFIVKANGNDTFFYIVNTTRVCKTELGFSVKLKLGLLTQTIISDLVCKTCMHHGLQNLVLVWTV
jgi:hypothetical protein